MAKFKLNLTELKLSHEFNNDFNETLDEFLIYHPSFCKSVVQKSTDKIISVIKESLVEAAEFLLQDDYREESVDVDVEIYTIFEILSGEEPTGISCIKFNLKFIYFLVKKLEDRSTFEFPEAKYILKNAIKYRELYKDSIIE